MLIMAEGLEPHRETVEIVADAGVARERVWLQSARALELPPPGTWLFDPPHTAIRFIARHVGMAHVHGRFERFEGGLMIAQDMTQSRVHVRIDASSITTGNNTRDAHLRSADFLDVERFPYIDFTSTRFAYRGGSKWTLQGSLTMHGVSRSVSLDTTYLGTVNGGYGEELRCAALAKSELHREDYTLNWRSMLARGIAVVGPTIQLEMDVHARHAHAARVGGGRTGSARYLFGSGSFGMGVFRFPDKCAILRNPPPKHRPHVRKFGHGGGEGEEGPKSPCRSGVCMRQPVPTVLWTCEEH
jgi:polyisoprenoid-binding protein YceI